MASGALPRSSTGIHRLPRAGASRRRGAWPGRSGCGARVRSVSCLGRARHSHMMGAKLRVAVLLWLLWRVGSIPAAEAAAYRDELTFLGRTTFLLREYALVVPVDLKRQPVQGG